MRNPHPLREHAGSRAHTPRLPGSPHSLLLFFASALAMASFTLDLRGDKQLIAKLNDLARGITGPMKNRAFKPAAHLLREESIENITHRKHRLGAKGNMRVKAMPRSRVMMGVMVHSQFGSTNAQNDPYYGAFVHWGHKIVGPGGVDTGKKTKPVLYMEKAFEANKEQAANEAATNLKREIEQAWAKQRGAS